MTEEKVLLTTVNVLSARPKTARTQEKVRQKNATDVCALDRLADELKADEHNAAGVILTVD